MNQTIKTARRASPAKNGHHGDALSATSAEVRAQARELDATFKALARNVLVDDDPAAELPLRQFRVCIALFDGGPRSMTQLSRELGVSQSAITQIADRLQAAGMVKRSPAGDDRRVRSLQLTTRARKLMRLREENRVARVVAILEEMSGEVRDKVLASMSLLRDACDND